MRHAVILGATADIGWALTNRLLADGWTVTGLGRRIDALPDRDGFQAVSCDLGSPDSIKAACAKVRALPAWDLFVSSAGTMEPIGPFFDLDFDAWETSLIVNASAQLRVLHGIWSNRSLAPDVMFMAGGGTNNPFPNYSAYCASKILLIKMCELIDDEAPEANAFIIGPGFTRTKIHDETLRAGIAAGSGLGKTQAFLDSDPGTSMDDIYAHMRWCMAQGRSVAGGRNFSTVHDPWGGSALGDALRDDPDAFRLRRVPAQESPK